jgi:AcrR family transcriptional regulator
MTTTATPVDTKTALLDAAEAVMSEHGFAGASLRAITSNAGTNLAAVSYHFGSKEELARAVIARHLGPLTTERLRLLDEAEQDGGGLGSLVRAFVAPVVRFGQHLPDSGRHFAQLCGRAMTQPEPVLRELMIGELGDAIHRFKSAFSRALPRLPREELLWRIQFMVGAMAHTMATLELIDEIHQGFLDTRDVEGIVDRMTRFVVAGLQAPMTEDSE